MTHGTVNIRRGRTRGSFHALRLARRVAKRTGRGPATVRTHLGAVRARRTRILAALTLVLCVEAAVASLTSPLLGVNRVALRGVQPLPTPEEAATRAAAALAPGTNLLRAPLGRTESRIRALPWVRSAHVGWLSPHALSVRITPREPTVIADIAGRSFELDAAAVPIRVARPELARTLPHVAVDRPTDVRLGTPLHDESLLAAIGIYRDAPRQPMVRIAKIRVDPAGNMCLNMVDGMQVQLGQPEDITVKMNYIQRVYQLNSNVCSRLVAINLSVPRVPACTLKSDVATGSAAPSEPPPASSQEPDGTVI